MASKQNDEWSGLVIKAAVGVVAVAVLGFAAWSLAKEDELEVVGPLVKKRIGKVQVEHKNGIEVLEFRQLLKIMEMIKELARQKMDKAYS